MRPDVIDWNRKSQAVAVDFIPRMARRSMMPWLLALAAVNVGAGVLAIALLQSPWRFSIPGYPAPINIEGRVFADGIAAFVVSAAITSLVALLIARWRMRKWSRRVDALHEALRHMARGVDPKPVAVAGKDELAYLAVAFNDMAGRLQASRHELVEANERLESCVALRTRQLAESNEELDRKNAALDELAETALRFTDDVAHELRTPLAVISEFASIISDGISGEVSPEQVRYLGFIIEASRDLAGLVDDFLDSSKLRAGSLRVDRQVHEVRALIDSVQAMIESRAAHKDVAVTIDVAGDLPSVYVDGDKVRRTVINLAINAIKFSRQGDSIALRAKATDDGGVQISVQDHGSGMSPAELESVFERFQQCAEGRVNTTKGFGLGLAIVHELVQLNMGRVSVESQPRLGSTFSFTLPGADVETVLAWYGRLTRERNSSADVTALRVRFADGREASDELDIFLSASLRPHDLKLPATDEDGGVTVMTDASSAHEWIDRLRGLWAEQGDDMHESDLDVAVLGRWPAIDFKPGDLLITAVPAASSMEVMTSV